MKNLNQIVVLSVFALATVFMPIYGICDDKQSNVKKIENFELRDYRGKTWRMEDFSDSKILVVTFLGTECPLVKLYAKKLQTYCDKYKNQKVQFVAINSNQQDSISEIANFAKTFEIDFPVLKDVGNHVADDFGAQRTPEVFVLDEKRNVRYRGKIDDQHTYGIQRDRVENHYLVDAIEALVADKAVVRAQTEAVGCHIGRILPANETGSVTYGNQISRILNDHCVSCHRPGEIAPFSLIEYDEVVGWAAMINEVVQDQRMPPWHANPEHGTFSNDIRLTESEKELIRKWVDDGAPKGDLANVPKLIDHNPQWRIGTPDLIVNATDKPFKVPAQGTVEYQYFVVDPGFKEDKWIQAAECRPGNRSVVHHILVALDRAGRTKARVHGDVNSEWIVATAPGAKPLQLPEGYAKFIPAGSKLVFQMHYTPNGTPQTDISSVGFIFADPETVKKQVFTQEAHNQRFAIPPGADNHKVESGYQFKHTSEILHLFPHMHLRGKAFRYIAVYPDGKKEILLDVPNYDFNWQNAYVLAEPKVVPAGTRMHCIAHFDNSEENLANPDPTKTVRWGDQTWEEMMIGYFDIALADQELNLSEQSGRNK
jgi:peroxiredoxin